MVSDSRPCSPLKTLPIVYPLPVLLPPLPARTAKTRLARSPSRSTRTATLIAHLSRVQFNPSNNARTGNSRHGEQKQLNGPANVREDTEAHPVTVFHPAARLQPFSGAKSSSARHFPELQLMLVTAAKS
jgi:hypothetical protein